MPFGHKVVTLVLLSDGPTKGDLGTYEQVETPTDAPGCRHRPLTFKETAELQFDVATEIWKTTLPIGEYSQSLRTAILALRHDDVIRVDGAEYSMIGPVAPYDDFTGPFKATIYSKKHAG